MGAEVSGFQFYERSATQAADCAAGVGPIQGTNPGTDEPDPRCEHRANGRGVIRYLRGWLGYLGRCQTPSVLRRLEEWTRRRLRSAIWKQWKRSRVRFGELRRRGAGTELAAQTVGSSHGPWRLANSPALALALSNAYFNSLGIPSLTGGS